MGRQYVESQFYTLQHTRAALLCNPASLFDRRAHKWFGIACWLLMVAFAKDDFSGD